MYIKSDIQFQQRNGIGSFGGDVNALFIEFDGKYVGLKGNVIVGILYRPPNTSVQEFNANLMSLFDKLKLERKICYLMGDFNVNLIRYNNHADTTNFVN